MKKDTRHIKSENERVERGFPKNPDNITKNELHKHFDLDDDGTVTLDEYNEHINYHCENPDVLEEKLEEQRYDRGFKYKEGGKTWYHTYGGRKHKRVYDPNIDYFDKYTLLPQEIYTILLEEGELEDYQQTERLLDKVEAKGWTFDFGLDNSPYGIRPIGEKTNLYAKGGDLEDKYKVRNISRITGGMNPKFRIEFNDGFEMRSNEQNEFIDSRYYKSMNKALNEYEPQKPIGATSHEDLYNYAKGGKISSLDRVLKTHTPSEVIRKLKINRNPHALAWEEKNVRISGEERLREYLNTMTKKESNSYIDRHFAKGGELNQYKTDNYKVGDTIKMLKTNWKVEKVNYKPGKQFRSAFIYKDGKLLNIPNPPKTNRNAVGYLLKDPQVLVGLGSAFYYQYRKGNVLYSKLVTEGQAGFKEYAKGGEVSLYFQQGSSDKEYHIQMEEEDGGYVVNFQYGRRGRALKSGTKTASPVSLEQAQNIYDKLLNSKVAKGYSVGESTTQQFSGNIPTPKMVHKLPQLLNMVFTTAEFINDNSYLAQEKRDGERRMVVSNSTGITGLNKKGQEVPLPNNIVDSINDECIIDGEIIGDNLYAFDILSLNGEDLEGEPCIERISTLNTLKFGEGVIVVETAYNTDEKQEMFDKLEREHREGIVFKKKDAPYTHGRPNSGGTQLKYKFYKTATFIVANLTPGKRSVGLELMDNGDRRFMGKVTIPPNKEIPNVGDLVEVRYLYAYKDGAVYQPTYIWKREDSDLTDATIDQIIYKSEDYEKGGNITIKKNIKDIEDGDVIVLGKNKHFQIDYIDPWSAGGRILVGRYVETGKKDKLKVKFLTPKGNTGLADDTMLSVYKEGGRIDEDLEYALQRTDYINECGKVLDEDFNELRNEEGEVLYIKDKDWHRFNRVDKNWELIFDDKRLYDDCYAKGGSINAKYLNSISNEKRERILSNIANHYGTTTTIIQDNVIYDEDAEKLYEYIANDNKLRMEVYNSMEKKYAKGGFLHRGEEKASWYWDTQMDRDARVDFLEEIEEDVNLGENRFYMKGYKYDDLPTKVQKEIVHRFQFAKGGEVKKKGNEMLIGGLAGILLGIFLNK